jgi:hypothetical protein
MMPIGRSDPAQHGRACPAALSGAAPRGKPRRGVGLARSSVAARARIASFDRFRFRVGCRLQWRWLFPADRPLFHLQVVQHDYYTTRAEDNRISLVPIVPNRGVIVDRNGVVLARNYSAFTLEITPSKVDDLDATIDGLAR